MTGRARELQVAVVLIALAAPVAAQEGPVAFEFSFSNPGARSMGLGGAFAALADDATAAFANPAGLVQLLESEVSLEGRWWSYDIPYVAGELEAGQRLHQITRHLFGLFSGLPGARAWRRELGSQGVRPGAGIEVIQKASRRVGNGGGVGARNETRPPVSPGKP